MRFLFVLLLSLLVSSTAQARPGFYFGLGAGATSVGGQDIPFTAFGVDEQGRPPPFIRDGTPWSTVMDGGFSPMVRLGFNVLGYAALETLFTGHGHDIDDADLRSWSAHWHLGARVYPMWHWQAEVPPYLQAFEPSLFLGWGGSYQVYTPDPTADEVGWSSWGSWRMGMGLEYFVASYFKVGIDYNYVNAPYDNFIFNFDKSENFPVEADQAGVGYHQVFFVTSFQFTVEDQPVRYSREAVDL